ncbi:Carbohydrate binding family 6 [Streptomyces davaonensis JCM 4913]|uniref:Carbohydrate binding family 6 n=1 Tax=Streptomyces davaonensis (strain DSM 101723 / JCM 4913 / KCC S-0913 / 768) TaxID=1214101 RepID=K4QZJ7_STRDJ|nr:Carbohydrate binding family 6 [Streptomyces davaonensis JCM 4913]
MRSSSYSPLPGRRPRTLVVPALAAALTVAFATAAPAARTETARPTYAKPYMGWTSWSMQSSKYPGLNPNGDYSYLSEANVTQQTDAMAAKLKPYGYEYVNIDAGWWMDWSWKPHYDEYGRQQADPERFPSGMKAVADRIHAKGLKAGIYLPVGLEKQAYGEGKTPIWNAGRIGVPTSMATARLPSPSLFRVEAKGILAAMADTDVNVTVSDSVLVGPTAGLAGRQACGDLVRPPPGGRGR